MESILNLVNELKNEYLQKFIYIIEFLNNC